MGQRRRAAQLFLVFCVAGCGVGEVSAPSPDARSPSGDGASSPTDVAAPSDRGTDAGADTRADAGSSDAGEPLTFDNHARLIRLTTLELNQQIAIPLAAEGKPIEPADRLLAGGFLGRLVKGRPGLLRAFWKTEAGFVPRDIEARVVLEHSGEPARVLRQVMRVAADPDPALREGTFSFVLTSADVRPGMRYSISLHEPTPTPTMVTTPPRIPASGTADLGVPDLDMRMVVVWVPTIKDDGSQATLDAASLKNLQAGWYDLLPVTELHVVVHKPERPWDWVTKGAIADPDRDIFADDGNSHTNIRTMQLIAAKERAPDFVYYMALVPGINVNGGWYDSRFSAINHRQAISAPHTGDVMTQIHELGHNQAMWHNPGCGANNDDDWKFGTDSTIHAWGYSLATGALFPPDSRHDYMSYCSPTWVSPHTHFKTYERIKAMSLKIAAACGTPPNCPWLTTATEAGTPVPFPGEAR